MKKLQEIDAIRGKGTDKFEGEIISGNRYDGFKLVNRYLFE